MATSALNGDIVDIYTTFQFVGNVCLHLLEILQTNVQTEAHIHNNIVSNCQDCCHPWIDQTGSRHRCFISDASLVTNLPLRASDARYLCQAPLII